MRYPKILGLLAVAAAAMMAFAASASADYLSTGEGGAAATPTMHAVSEGGHISIHNPEANIECASTFQWTPNIHGAGKSISGPLSSLSFTGCTNGWAVTVDNKGTLSVEHTSGNNGTVSSNEMTLTASFFFDLVTCRYKTANTHIGTLTGGNPGTIHLEGKLPVHSPSSPTCGTESAQLTGKYLTTSSLYVNNS